MIVKLEETRAPKTVANFVGLATGNMEWKDPKTGDAQKGVPLFDGVRFHRVIPDFMIQGGGMDDKMREKTEGARAPIKNEASNGVSNKRGTIAMARTNNPDSATSQFFINLVDNARGLDPRPGSAGYAVFGKVVSGMETVDAIAKVPTGQRGPHGDVPTTPVYIKSAKRKAKS